MKVWNSPHKCMSNFALRTKVFLVIHSLFSRQLYSEELSLSCPSFPYWSLYCITQYGETAGVDHMVFNLSTRARVIHSTVFITGTWFLPASQISFVVCQSIRDAEITQRWAFIYISVYAFFTCTTWMDKSNMWQIHHHPQNDAIINTVMSPHLDTWDIVRSLLIDASGTYVMF